MTATAQLLRQMGLGSKLSHHEYSFLARVFVNVKPVHNASGRSFSQLQFGRTTLASQRLLDTSTSTMKSLHMKYVNNNKSSTSSQSQANDSDSDKGSLVYQGRISSAFKSLKLFSLTTSAIGLSLQPYLFFTYQDTPLVTALPFFTALNIFVFVNPLLIHSIGKKYVMEVYFNQTSKVFTAVLMSFFARKYNFTFTAKDVHVPDVPGMFSILTVKGRPLFVLEADFTDLEVYKHMMGFDKPLDLSFLKDDKQDQTQ